MRRDLFDLMRTGLKAINQPEYFVNGPNMKSNQFASENFFFSDYFYCNCSNFNSFFW